MALLLFLVLGGVLFWLKMYTNHGQKLEMPDYVGKYYKDAIQDSDDRSFEMIVKDSIHKVGQPGGLVISQNPTAGSFVKENRKIYVDITKYNADEIKLSSISKLYGGHAESKAIELGYLDIKTEVLRYIHDAGEPDHIMEVWYEGKMIDGPSGRKLDTKIKKGSTVGLVLSKMDGGLVEVPDLVCTSYSQLGFILQVRHLSLGSIEQIGAITDRNKAYIVAQTPAYSKGRKINMGDKIEVIIQQELPESCQ